MLYICVVNKTLACIKKNDPDDRQRKKAKTYI